jgi:hypothetical protein
MFVPGVKSQFARHSIAQVLAAILRSWKEASYKSRVGQFIIWR